MLITANLEANARSHPDEVALVERDQQGHTMISRRELTWREFDLAANRVANLLLASGITKGQRVAILMLNCLEWLPIYFGVLRAGAVVVPLSFRCTTGEIEHCLGLADVEALVFGPEFIERLAALGPHRRPRLLWFVGAGCPQFAADLTELSGRQPVTNPQVQLTADDDAAIYFSSGTTGLPKAILHGHRALSHAAVVEQQHHGQTRDDVFLCIPPLYHTGAKMHWFGSLLTGGRAVLLRGVDPESILRVISDEGCSNVWLLVPWAQDILLAIEAGQINLVDYDLSRWDLTHIGAQPVPPSLIRRWKTIFPAHRYDTNYGLSEAMGPGCVHLGLDNIAAVGAIGRPGHGWTARVVDEHLHDVPVGECGELAVKGPGVMKGYYKDPDATAAALVDGWLLTGDVVRQDAEGFLWLVDRKKDVIITGGENIYPVQVESFLVAHPGIKDAALIGIPDERLGETALAVIEPKPGVDLTEAGIADYCEQIPRYRRPRRIVFSPVPRNATGKIDKPLLRSRYGQQLFSGPLHTAARVHPEVSNGREQDARHL